MEKVLMETVKAKAHSLGITQKQVATRLKVSVPTVKRWWSGKGVTLQTLNRICVLLGVPLSELIADVENRASARYTYTLEQERMLVQNPKALGLFDLLVSGKTLASIKTKYLLSESVATALLLKLDRAKLIQLGVQNKIKLVKAGEPQWIAGGPLSQTFRKTMISSFLGEHSKPETVFLIHDYLPEDAALIQARLKDLEKLMAVCNARSHTLGATASYGVYMTFKKFEWDLRDSLAGN